MEINQTLTSHYADRIIGLSITFFRWRWSQSITLGYFKIPVELFMNVIYYHGLVTICSDLINMFAPLEQVLAQQNHLL